MRFLALFLSDSNEELRNSAERPPTWTDRRPVIPITYTDDSNGIERLNTKNAVVKISERKQSTLIHARHSETFFNTISSRSEQIGMKINPSKTQLLCLSNNGPNCHAFIRLGETKKVSDEKLKICGYNFGTRPDVSVHIEDVERKFNERAWILRNLKWSGFMKDDLVVVYKSLIGIDSV